MLTTKEQQVLTKFDKWVKENNPSDKFLIEIAQSAGRYLIKK